MSSVRPRNHMHILVLVGAVAIVGLFMPLFTGGGNVPTGDALTLIETTFTVVSNSTSNQYNATSDNEADILQLIAGDGMIITVDSANDRFMFNSTGAGGGENNLGANVGGATGEIFRDKTGVTLNFKTISSAGDGIVITNNADTVGLSLNNIPKSEISLTGTWVKADLPSLTLYQDGNLGSCSDGQVMKWQQSNTTWICGTDVSGGSGDLITEGNTSVETIDAGTGQVDIDVDGIFEYRFNSTDFDVNTNTLKGSMGCTNGQILEYNSSTDRWACGTDDASGSSDIITEGDSNAEIIDLGTGQMDIDLDGANEYWFNSTVFDVNTNVIAGSMGCNNGEILEYNSGSDRWECGVDDGAGGGITSINGDSTTTQVFSGTTNQVTITDTGAGTLQWDVGTDVVQIDQANTYADGNLQTFTDDDIRFQDNTGGQFYTLSTGDLVADRVISFPVLTGADVFVFEGSTATLTNKSIDADGTGNSITNIEDADIKAGAAIAWSKINKSGSLINDLGNVNASCANGQIMEYNSTSTNWECGNDDASGSSDIITEGDSNVEVIDGGTGQVDIDIDGVNEVTITGNVFDLVGISTFDMPTNGKVRFNSDDDYAVGSIGTDMKIEVPVGNEIRFDVESVIEYNMNATAFDMNNNKLAGSMGCSNGQILEYNSSTDGWDCGADDTGGGSNALLDGSVHTDTVAQGVTRGSLIYGDATPNWNELLVGGAGTILKSDGTDVSWGTGTLGTEVTGASTSLTDTANIAYLNTPNAYVDGNLQTFTDDDIEFSNPAGTFQYILSTGAIGADRVVSFPVLTGNDVFVFEGSSATLTNKSFDADGTGNSITNIENADIKAGAAIAWSKISKTGSLVGDMGDVVNGCADTNVLKYQTSNSTWICATDNVGGSADIIQEGDSNVEVIDAGTGQVDIDIDTTNEYIFTGTQVDLNQNNIVDSGSVSFDDTNTSFEQSGSNLLYDVATGGLHDIRVNDASEFSFNATDLDVNTNTLKGSMGCTNGQILEYNSGTDRWACGTDDTGGGSNALLDGSVHTDTVAQTVSRGSLIYGDATPNWNELVIGGANTMLISDGTDVSWGTGTIGNHVTGASTSLTDTGDIAYLNTANTYVDGNIQTFTDDDIRFQDNTGGQFYTLSTGDLVADRVVSFPVLTGNDVFVFEGSTATLTNKSFDADGAGNSITNIEDADIKAGANIAWSKINKSGSLIGDLGNVTPSCNDGQILEYQSSNSTWICGADDTGGGGDIITEGDSNVEVIDAGIGQIDIDVDGAQEYYFNSTVFNIGTNVIMGSMGCTNAESLEYNATTTTWECRSINETVDQTHSTGVLTGGVLSTGAGSNQYSISDGTGVIVTSAGVQTPVSWSGKSNIVPTNLATNLITFVSIDSGGNVVEQTAKFTTDDCRLRICLGVAVHVDNVNVDAVNNEQVTTYNVRSQLFDLAQSIGFFNVDGNVFSANGPNLTLDKSSGKIFAQGSNYNIDVDDPNVKTLASLTGLTFQYRFSDGSNGATGTNIDPNNLDDGAGGTTAVDNNKWSVQRIYSFVSNNVKIQRGVADYATSTDAINSITLEPYVTEPSIKANGILRGWLAVQQGATALNGAQAVFIEAPKFGEGGGGAGGSGTTIFDENLILDVQKGTAGTINAGQVVRITGYDATDGVTEVELADASVSTTMPALGIARETITQTSTGQIIVSGLIGNLNTSTYTEGDELYVSETTGAFTDVKPTGTAEIQKIGIVVRSDTTEGIIEVIGAGRSNDVPNSFVADPSKTTLTCGAGQPQVSASPPKATIDGTALDYVVCDYSDGVTERLVWTYEMPDDMDSTGNIDMTIHFTTTGTAGVCWDVAFLPLVSDEVIDGTWSTLAGGCDSATVTGDLEEATISVASGTHGVVGGDTVFIKLERDFADATDTNTNDARFISMEMAWN